MATTLKEVSRIHIMNERDANGVQRSMFDLVDVDGTMFVEGDTMTIDDSEFEMFRIVDEDNTEDVDHDQVLVRRVYACPK